MPIKLGILGSSGKIGSELIRLSDDPDFALIHKFGANQLTLANLDELDLLIDFSVSAATSTLLRLLPDRLGCAVVIGTTALDQETFEIMRSKSRSRKIFYSSNFSFGIALLRKFLETNKDLINAEYEVGINEIHHRHKIDAPSGTALLLEASLGKKVHTNSHRLSEIFGIHDIILSNPHELIDIRHMALSRSIFASNALKVSKWLISLKVTSGFFGMDDFLEKVDTK